jgi:hypothetical protein
MFLFEGAGDTGQHSFTLILLPYNPIWPTENLCPFRVKPLQK